MIKKHKLVTEPFLAIGTIDAILRILIITAEQVHPTPEYAAAFKMTMLDSAFFQSDTCVGSVYFLLRRHGRYPPIPLLIPRKLVLNTTAGF